MSKNAFILALAIASIAIVAQAAPTTLWEDAYDVVPETDFVTSVAYDYHQIHKAGDCCRNNGALVHHVANGGAQTPADCEPECSARPDCHYFSHSNKWKNCALCSQCDFTTSGNGKYYTSWERTPAPTPPPTPAPTPQPTPHPTQAYQCTGWPCSSGGPGGGDKERCECGNNKRDGFHYLYNEGRTATVAGVCGSNKCWCCRRPSVPSDML